MFAMSKKVVSNLEVDIIDFVMRCAEDIVIFALLLMQRLAPMSQWVSWTAAGHHKTRDIISEC